MFLTSETQELLERAEDIVKYLEAKSKIEDLPLELVLLMNVYRKAQIVVEAQIGQTLSQMYDEHIKKNN